MDRNNFTIPWKLLRMEFSGLYKIINDSLLRSGMMVCSKRVVMKPWQFLTKDDIYKSSKNASFVISFQGSHYTNATICKGQKVTCFVVLFCCFKVWNTHVNKSFGISVEQWLKWSICYFVMRIKSYFVYFLLIML